MARKRKIIVGNWKMDPEKVLDAKLIFSKIKRAVLNCPNVLAVICPADIHLMMIAKSAGQRGVKIGVQDVFWEDDGFFTGQVSPLMARDAGASYAIVGHSEKRKLGETNEQTAKKLKAIIRDGLTGILCVGEPERDKDGNYLGFLKNQILSSLSQIGRPELGKSLIIAYEPVWEIGRSDMQAMKPRDVRETAIYIKKILNDAFGADIAEAVPIIYGGSVSNLNAQAIIYEGEIDGLLVGRQSLNPELFKEILVSINNGR